MYKVCNLKYAGEKGFEPLTFGFGDHYSTIETILLLRLKHEIFCLFFSIKMYLDVKKESFRRSFMLQPMEDVYASTDSFLIIERNFDAKKRKGFHFLTFGGNSPLIIK
jgi:hypothetical protein